MSPVTAVIQKVVVHKGRVYILSGEIYDKVSQAILQGKIEDIDKMLRNIEPTQKLKANPDYYKSDEPLQEHEEFTPNGKWPQEVVEKRWVTSDGESHRSRNSAIINQSRIDSKNLFARLRLPWHHNSSERNADNEWVTEKGQRLVVSIMNQLPVWYMVFRQVAEDETAQVDNSTRARNAADWIERELKNKGY